ncbi:MAG TPA: hypothetical protein VF980_00245 [Thermoanaerobaculia bacterium]
MKTKVSLVIVWAFVVIAVSVVANAQATPAVAHWFRGSGAQIKVTATAPPYQRVAQFLVPAGSWVLHGTATAAVSDTVDTAKVVHKGSLTCSFAGGADGFSVMSPSPSGTFGYSTGMMVPVAFQAALTYSSPTTITLDCIEGDVRGEVKIWNIQLVATPVSSVLRH